MTSSQLQRCKQILLLVYKHIHGVAKIYLRLAFERTHHFYIVNQMLPKA